MPSLRRNRQAVIALCAVLWLLCAPAAQAAASFVAGVLNDRAQTVELTPQAAFAPGSLAASSVLSGGTAFSPNNPVSAPALSSVWIRVPLRIQKGAAGPWVISMPR